MYLYLNNTYIFTLGDVVLEVRTSELLSKQFRVPTVSTSYCMNLQKSYVNKSLGNKFIYAEQDNKITNPKIRLNKVALSISVSFPIHLKIQLNEPSSVKTHGWILNSVIAFNEIMDVCPR